MLDLEVIRRRATSTEDINELYSIELDITKYVNELYAELREAKGVRIGQVKSELSYANAILPIVRERKASIKDTGSRLNYNFRMAAMVMLKQSTYQSIMEKAALPRKVVKEIEKELKQNKIE